MINRTGESRRGPYLQEIIQPQQQLDQTKFYKIKSVSNDFCLREELKSYKIQEGDKVRIIGGDPADQPLSFLWMVKGHDDNNKQKNEKMFKYELIHGSTNLSLMAQDNECHLTEQRQPYYFTLQPVKRGAFKIRDQDDCYLNLDGILETTELANQDSNQQFIFEPITADKVKQLLGTCFILSKKKIYALDLATSKQNQDEIILVPQNYRMSQRWFFMKVQAEKEQLSLRASIDHNPNVPKYKVYIRNVITEQYVSYSKQKKKLVQSSYPQQWYIQQNQHSEGFYIIRHVKQSQYLNYNNDNKLTLGSEKCDWFIPQSRTILQKSYRIQGRRTF